MFCIDTDWRRLRIHPAKAKVYWLFEDFGTCNPDRICPALGLEIYKDDVFTVDDLRMLFAIWNEWKEYCLWRNSNG